jgi:hypothetical protein
MMPTRLPWVLPAILFLLLAGPVSRADAPVRRTAFAVVIGNNRSLGIRRPDLHYADDDAAKYFTIFQTVASGGVTLLADFDDDTARLFPEARAHAIAPTRAELLRVGHELAERVQRANGTGGETDVYFVFAGHGDVDEGLGFVDLLDSRFTSVDLEQWLRAIPFSHAHVILDSCNSFFMLGSRRPGGHYYATSEDAARSLSTRLPNVGVFLSTSAEGESFEWSEIQSGIFSHVVRSGLLGAADANGDGAVSYVELAAFVATATGDVPNPNMRPHVFSRGPGGHDETAILPAGARTGARTLRLSDAASLRVRLRDRESLPLFDANEEAGQGLVLAIPDAWADGAILERPTGGAVAGALQTFAVPASSGDLTLASLQPVLARGTPRGPAEVFRSLFARPFGARALAKYVAQVGTEPPQVYGVSREDAERMDFLLREIASAEHGQRVLSGSASVGVGALVGVVGGSMLYYGNRLNGQNRSSANAWGGSYVGFGALMTAYGLYTLAEPWSGEQAAFDYRAALGSGTDYARAFVAAEARLHVLSAREAQRHWLLRGMGALFVVGSAAAITYIEATATSPTDRVVGRAFGGSSRLSSSRSWSVGSLRQTAHVQIPHEHIVAALQVDAHLAGRGLVRRRRDDRHPARGFEGRRAIGLAGSGDASKANLSRALFA